MNNAFMKTALLCVLVFGLPGLAQAAGRSARKPDLTVQKWYGNAICYSGYRAGQSPKLKVFPTHA